MKAILLELYTDYLIASFGPTAAQRRWFMRIDVALILVLLGCPQVPAPSISAITHVTLIDGTGAMPAHDVTVLVQGDEILRIGPADSVDVPAGTEVFDGSGRFLLPGLWDMHVHVSRSLGGREVLPVFLAYGVTGVRDVGSADSIAIWDNRSTQHYAASDYWPRRRVMERVAITGDRPA